MPFKNQSKSDQQGLFLQVAVEHVGKLLDGHIVDLMGTHKFKLANK
jgi:hypothetical protein